MAIADFVKKIVQTAHFFKLKNLKKEKTHYEFAYWEERKKAEGILGNQHYEYFYTLHFNLNAISYNRKSILDIGCGPRGSLEWANMASIRVGLDPLVFQYLGLGSYQHKMQYEAAESECIPHSDESFDVVSSFNSLDHVNDLLGTIAEIKRVIKPGGFFLLLTEVNHKPTKCEPITFSWDLVDHFGDSMKLVDIKHYEKSKPGMYDSILAGVPYDHSNQTKRYGILSAKFLKKPKSLHP